MNDTTLRHFLTISYLLMITALFSCNADRSKKVDIEDFDFSTTDASELYFKNVRESYYEIEEKDGIKIYRLKDYQEVDSSFFQPMIVFHWRSDRAFLMLEFDESVDAESLSIRTGDVDKVYQVIQIKDHLTLANDIYNAVVDEQDIFIEQQGEMVAVFNGLTEKSNFSLVLYDFFRFTNVY
ncbi:MAG: hypothetical protein AAFO69_04590 [Bacteroidota bacterium]